MAADAREGYVFRNRGPAYADGVVYAAAGSFLLALDAKTGKPIPTFGTNGQAHVILDVLKERYPDVKTPISMGYWFTSAPQVHNGVIYIGSTRSESHIPGGHVLAVDAKTGKVKWVFNTVPQDARDQGWEIAGPTWVGGERNGGGIWETPSIDPELNMLYVAVANPFGDSTKRAGTNLFSDSVIALTLDTGTLKWYFQQTHHDVWDYDTGSQPTLFDMTVNGQRVKALASASKNGFVYILNRETGKPVHPIVETPVPTHTDTPGEQPWPTQPIPHTAKGKMMEPASPVVGRRHPAGAAHEVQDRADVHAVQPRPRFTPREREAVRITVPCPTARGPGYLYVNAIDQPTNSGRGPRMLLLGVRPDDRRARLAHDLRGVRPGRRRSSRRAISCSSARAATKPATSSRSTRRRATCSGSSTPASGVFSSPSTYMVNGEQFVTVGSGGGERGRRGGDLILSFALPQD